MSPARLLDVAIADSTHWQAVAQGLGLKRVEV